MGKMVKVKVLSALAVCCAFQVVAWDRLGVCTEFRPPVHFKSEPLDRPAVRAGKTPAPASTHEARRNRAVGVGFCDPELTIWAELYRWRDGVRVSSAAAPSSNSVAVVSVQDFGRWVSVGALPPPEISVSTPMGKFLGFPRKGK